MNNLRPASLRPSFLDSTDSVTKACLHRYCPVTPSRHWLKQKKIKRLIIYKLKNKSRNKKRYSYKTAKNKKKYNISRHLK